MIMSFRLAANLGFLFGEHGNLLQRYSAASKAGFTAVECPSPYDHSLRDVVRAKEEAGVEQVLINSYPGNVSAGEFGLACIPGREQDFRNSLEVSIEYAKALKCSRIHVLAGKQLKGILDVGMTQVYEDNLVSAAERFEKDNITGVIEAINLHSFPHYFLSSYQKAAELVRKIDSPCLKLQVDIFHLQIIEGDITRYLRELLPITEHIQIAQVPDRMEPNTSGELNYRYIFEVLKHLGYSGNIGLEYRPKTSTEEGLKWIKEFGLSL